MKLFVVFLLTLMLFSGCKKTPLRIDRVEQESFGKLSPERYCDGDLLVLPRRVMSNDDTLELALTPLSRQVWRIDIVIPQVPGDEKSDPVSAVKELLEPRYKIKFDAAGHVNLAGTGIHIRRAFDRGPRGVCCSFTDLELQKFYQQETAHPEALLRQTLNQARQEILILENALHEFNLDTGVYPDSLMFLLKNDGSENWHGPYLRSLSPDPWGRDYIYRKKTDGYELYSTGADGRSKLR